MQSYQINHVITFKTFNRPLWRLMSTFGATHS